MKYLFAAILLAFWLCTSVVLGLSVVGWFVISQDEWLEIPAKLLKVFEQ